MFHRSGGLVPDEVAPSSLRLWTCLFVLVALVLVSSACFHHRSQAHATLRTEHETLAAVARLKCDQIQRWRTERLQALRSIACNPSFARVIQACLARADGARGDLLDRLQISRELLGLAAAFVVLPDGRQLGSVPDLPGTFAGVDPGLVNDAISASRPLLGNPFLGADRDPHLDAAGPVLAADGRPLAVVVFRSGARDFLLPLLQTWPTPSSTAETLLVRRDGDTVIFLNDLRHEKGTALAKKIPLSRTDMPGVRAVLGGVGEFEGRDYRGEEVLADLRQIPGSDWCVVAKVDRSEIMARVQHRGLEIAALTVVSLLLAGTAAAYGHRISQEEKRRLASVKLRALAFRQEALLAAIPDIVTEVDANKVYVWANRAGYEFFGDDMIGKSASDYFVGEQDTYETVRPVFDGTEDVICLESLQRRKDGENRLLAWWCRTLRDGQGNVIGALSSARDITEQKRRECELRETNDELARFTYTVSHDLKSPLVTIQTFLGYLETDLAKPDPERTRQDMDYIRGAADKMGRMLSELLDLSRVGRKIDAPQLVPLQAIVREALDLVAGRISERGVQVEVTPEPISVFGDRGRLVAVYQNLVDNAVKYMGTQAAPRIEIGAERPDGRTVLFVRDNGIGVDPRHIGKLFGLFERLEPNVEGTGIGLALVRRVVQLHGGKIWAESDGAGKGTTFRFTLGDAVTWERVEGTGAWT